MSNASPEQACVGTPKDSTRFSDNLDRDCNNLLLADFFVASRGARDRFESSWRERGSRFRQFFVEDGQGSTIDDWLAIKQPKISDFVHILVAKNEWALVEQMGLLSHHAVIESEPYDRDPAPLASQTWLQQ